MNAIQQLGNRAWAAGWALVMACQWAGGPRAESLEIRFDYSADTTGFFAEGTEGRRILESAANHYEVLLEDRLGELVASGSNSLTVSYINPPTQAMVTIVPPAIPADTILVYVGAANLPGSQIGVGYRGGINPRGTTPWLDYVDTRGQSGIVYGAGAHEVAPWGGSVTVDTRDAAGSARQWDYSLGVRPLGSGLHLYSLLIHELAHVLGFGTCDAWWGRVDGAGRFGGGRAMAIYGAKVPLDPSGTHWINGTASRVYGRSEMQHSAMDPILATDSVNYATELDIAGLRDIGWEIADPLPAPVPPTLGTAMSPGGGALILSWVGENRYQYTILESTDFSGWRATGPTLPGVEGPMQAALPTGSNALGYRLLVEHRLAPTGSALGMAAAQEPEAAAQDGTIATRTRPGGTAMRLGGHRAGTALEACGACAGGNPSCAPGSLRKQWERRVRRPVTGE